MAAGAVAGLPFIKRMQRKPKPYTVTMEDLQLRADAWPRQPFERRRPTRIYGNCLPGEDADELRGTARRILASTCPKRRSTDV